MFSFVSVFCCSFSQKVSLLCLPFYRLNKRNRVALESMATAHDKVAVDDEPSEELLISEAAQSIWEADFLLIATGAGFSADSGLPTYSDIARNPTYQQKGIDYSDVCRVSCLKNNPSLFYGFWGMCYNAYKETEPHAGYDILKKWCNLKQEKEERHLDGIASYYLYTSNVDGHFRRKDFPVERLHEMHGGIDTWLVVEENGKESASSLKIPEPFSFAVNPTTLELSPELILELFGNDRKSNASSETSLLRPRVLMFDDGFQAHRAMGLAASCDLYQNWEEQMEAKMARTDKELTLVVLEIGCGIRVPSVRKECEDVIADSAARCAGTDGKIRCTHIRINPDDDEIQDHALTNAKAISIRSTALKTLQAIDARFDKLHGPLKL
jgi:NAD-dependent SIR2 family protein deacetylase